MIKVLPEELISPEPMSGCHIWLGYCKPNGYGQVGRNKYAHRVAYMEMQGDIPGGLVIDHLCSTTQCVNPKHLQAVPQKENLRRGNGWSGKKMRQTHCVRNHELVPGNLIPDKQGRRQCRECKRMRSRGEV